MSGIKSEVAQRFGLRDIAEAIGGSPSSPTQGGPELQSEQAKALAGVYTTMARVLASQLQRMNGQANAFDLLEPLGIRIEELLPAIGWMQERKLVTVEERPRNGNWKLQLLPAGKALLER